MKRSGKYLGKAGYKHIVNLTDELELAINLANPFTSRQLLRFLARWEKIVKKLKSPKK